MVPEIFKMGNSKKTVRPLKVRFAGLVSVAFRSRTVSPEAFRTEKIERLLVIRQHDQMGDMLLAVPALRGLRKRYPEAEISLLASPANCRVMENNRYIDELIVLPKGRPIPGPLAAPRLISRLRRSRFDAAIVLNSVSFSVTSMLIAAISGARIRIGCSSERFGYRLADAYYDLVLPLPTEEELSRMHEARNGLFPLRSIGIEEDDLTSSIVPSREEVAEAENIIGIIDPKGRGYAVMHPGAGKKANRWPAARFGLIARRLSGRYGIPSIAIRGYADLEPADLMLAEYPDFGILISSPCEGTLSELMRRSVVTVCNDTGVMHIGGASGASVVVIFGPTESARWKPVNSSVIAVSSDDGNISSVKVDDVFDAIESIVAGVREGQGRPLS